MRLFQIPVILFLLSCFAFASPARADLPRAAAAVGLAYSAVTGVAAPIDEPPPVRGVEKSAAAGVEKIYFFTASWCPHCPAARKLADQLYGRGFPVSVVDVDNRKHRELVRKYQVEGIPEFVATRDGKLIKRRKPEETTTAEDLAQVFKAAGIEPIRRAPRENKVQSANATKTVANYAADYDRPIQIFGSPSCVGGNCSPAAVLPRQPVRATRRRR